MLGLKNFSKPEVASVDNRVRRIRIYKPILKDEKKDGREPFAELKYKNTIIEIDYTALLKIDMDWEVFIKFPSDFNKAKEEIIKEMELDIDNA